MKRRCLNCVFFKRTGDVSGECRIQKHEIRPIDGVCKKHLFSELAEKIEKEQNELDGIRSVFVPPRSWTADISHT